MRIFKATIIASAACAIVALAGSAPRAADRSAEQAYRASVKAMMARDFSGSIPGLKYASEHGVFLAQYYLARLYATDGQNFTNHKLAFEAFRALVSANRGVDPFIDKRAPFVANAERLLALYYRNGVPGAVARDPALARAHLEHAALRLEDTEAQFQLAEMDLQTPEYEPRALDQLDMLATTKHHAGAAAQIALVYSKHRSGRDVPVEALGYAAFAVKLASQADRVWIGDIYQTLFCEASPQVRIKAAAFRDELAHSAFDGTDGDRQPVELGRETNRVQGVLDLGSVDTQRVCSNGEAVPDLTGRAPERAEPAGRTAKGFNSAVGFIAPAMGLGLKELESPSAGDEHGEPLGGIDDQPTQ